MKRTGREIYRVEGVYDFATRMARGEIRHPVQEARLILGIPLVTDHTATDGPTTGGEQ